MFTLDNTDGYTKKQLDFHNKKFIDYFKNEYDGIVFECEDEKDNWIDKYQSEYEATYFNNIMIHG